MTTIAGDMHVMRLGEAGPSLIMVHGGAQGSRAGGGVNFRAQETLAERGWRLVVPDRPGHGQSPDPGRPDDAAADGALVASLIEDGSHLLGHSFGGCVALDAASRRPGQVRSLTLIEPAMLGLAASDPRVRRMLFRIVTTTFLSLSDAGRARRIMPILGIPPEIYANADAAEMARLGRSLRRVKVPSRATLQTQLETIKRAGIPVLVVSGGWNPAFEATCDRVAAATGGQRAVVDAGHHFPQWLGAAFNPILEGFLRDSDMRARPAS